MDEPAIYISSLHATAGWSFRTESFTSESVVDHIMRWGFNAGVLGGQAVAGVAAIMQSFEAQYKTGGVTYSEENHEFIDPTGTITRRYFSAACNHSDGTCGVTVLGTFTIKNSTNARFRIVVEDTTSATTNVNFGDVGAPTIHRCRYNNADAIQQLKSDGATYAGLIRVDSSDVMQLSRTGEAINVGGRTTIAAAALDFVSAAAKPLFWLKAPADTRLFATDYNLALFDGSTNNTQWYGDVATVSSVETFYFKKSNYTATVAGHIVTDAATVAIDGAPTTSGGNTTITNPHAFWVVSGRSKFGGPVELASYTVAGVPSASTFAKSMIYVSDESGGAVPAFSDGTNWRRVTDRAVIS